MGKRKIIILAVAIIAIVGITTFAFAGSKEKEYKVTFDSNGGSTIESQNVKSGEKATKPNTPTKENYEFAGWYLNLEDNTEYDFAKKVFGDITLHAKWNALGGTTVVKPDDDIKTPEENTKPDTTKKPTTNKPIKKPSTTKPSTNKPSTDKPTPSTPTEDPDVTKLNNAIKEMKPKNITKTGNVLGYSIAGCTVTVNSSKSSNSRTKVNKASVTELFRGKSNSDTITANYTITCGSQTRDVEIKHKVASSPYTYTSSYNGMVDIIVVSNNATDYILNINGTKASYLASVKGVQIGGNAHNNGTYEMTFKNDNSTVYEVTAQ